MQYYSIAFAFDDIDSSLHVGDMRNITIHAKSFNIGVFPDTVWPNNDSTVGPGIHTYYNWSAFIVCASNINDSLDRCNRKQYLIVNAKNTRL